MVSEKYGRAIRDPFDLEPEEEQLISRLFAEEYGSEFVFVTHYPSKKRPFYAADDPEDPRYTLSFDLLFRGLEVTTGGQRIHDYDTQVAKMLKKGMNQEDFAGYLMIHKYGTCPHGGLGLGLERLTARLLGENNVRETCLFPRDQLAVDKPETPVHLECRAHKSPQVGKRGRLPLRNVIQPIRAGELLLEQLADDLFLVPKVIVQIARADAVRFGDVVGGDGRGA